MVVKIGSVSAIKWIVLAKVSHGNKVVLYFQWEVLSQFLYCVTEVSIMLAFEFWHYTGSFVSIHCSMDTGFHVFVFC